MAHAEPGIHDLHTKAGITPALLIQPPQGGYNVISSWVLRILEEAREDDSRL
jgi:hypothetical protein